MHKDPPPGLLERPLSVVIGSGLLIGFVAGLRVWERRYGLEIARGAAAFLQRQSFLHNARPDPYSSRR